MPAAVSSAAFWLIQFSAVTVLFVPFTWGLVGLWAASHFLRAIGLTLAFHRYFAHRAFEMARPVRFFWAFVGTAAMQKGPLWWAGNHLDHHKYADREGDPHSPAVSGFYHAHIGWFLNDTRWKQVPATNPTYPVPTTASFMSLYRLARFRRPRIRIGFVIHDKYVPASRQAIPC